MPGLRVVWARSPAQLQGADYNRILVYLNPSLQSGDEMYEFTDQMRTIARKYYPDGDIYLAGDATNEYDFQKSFAIDNIVVRHAVDAADLLAEQGISATVLDMYCVKPLDAEAVIEAAGATRAVVTVEEHSPFGGLGSMVAQVVGEHCPRPVKCLSLPDAPVITGTSPEVFAHYGLTGEGIAKTVAEFLPAE